MYNANYCKKKNISIFLLPSINGSTIFTAGFKKLRYKSTTSSSGRRSHRPLLIKYLSTNFSFSPFIKQKILQHQICERNKCIYFYWKTFFRVPSIRRVHCRPANSLVPCSWVVPGVHNNHASEGRVHIINQLIIAGPTVSN